MRYQKGLVVQRRLVAFLALFAAVLVVAGCQSDGDSGDDGQLRIAASTALIGEFASIVAGDGIEVTTLIPAGVDVHSYEPSPATAGAIVKADVIFVNGYNLEEGLLKIVLENVADDVEVVVVAAGLTPLEGDYDDDDEDRDKGDGQGGGGLVRAEGDPHFWLDIENAIHYLEVIRDQLVELAPAERAGFESRAESYIEELRALDGEVRTLIGEIPDGQRRLVVMHDAYQYFAAAYGFELSAALLPAGAQRDPSAGAVVDLIELINELGVTAIFRESQFGASVLSAVADETDAEVLVLYSTFTDEVESYVELMRANARALVEGLGT